MLKRYKTRAIKDVEMALNHGLYWICAFITLVAMAMSVVEFFSRGVFFPNRINFFYLGVLIIYSLHKEMVRWLGKRKIERQGEYFVYAWIILTTVLYVINFVSKDYYMHMAQGGPNSDLRDISLLTLEVLGVFIFTRFLKIIELAIKEKKIKI